MKLSEIQTGPMKWFRAVPMSKEMPDEPFHFTLSEALHTQGIEGWRRLNLSTHYHAPDSFTGCRDKHDTAIYGGNIMRGDRGVYIIGWDAGALTWIIIDPGSGAECCLSSYIYQKSRKAGHYCSIPSVKDDEIIGNIHQIA